MTQHPINEKGLEAARSEYAELLDREISEQAMQRIIRAYLSTTPDQTSVQKTHESRGADDGLEVIDRICHKEQVGIWANEVLTALSLGDFLREEWTFADSVDAEREIDAQLRSIIATAISHPEFDLLANLETAEAEVKRLTEENEGLRSKNAVLDADGIAARRATAKHYARFKALEEALQEAADEFDGTVTGAERMQRICRAALEASQ